MKDCPTILGDKKNSNLFRTEVQVLYMYSSPTLYKTTPTKGHSSYKATPTKGHPSYEATPTKGHLSYQAKFQMHLDSKIILNFSPQERLPL